MTRRERHKARDAERRLRGDYLRTRTLEVLSRARTKISGDTVRKRVGGSESELAVVTVELVNMDSEGLVEVEHRKVRGRLRIYYQITDAGRRRLKELEDGR